MVAMVKKKKKKRCFWSYCLLKPSVRHSKQSLPNSDGDWVCSVTVLILPPHKCSGFISPDAARQLISPNRKVTLRGSPVASFMETFFPVVEPQSLYFKYSNKLNIRRGSRTSTRHKRGCFYLKGSLGCLLMADGKEVTCPKNLMETRWERT